MTKEWYELRVDGSAGTTMGIEAGMIGGKAVGDAGHLVSVHSGHARRFASVEEAVKFLGGSSIAQIYRFEVVRCTEDSANPVQAIPWRRQ